MPDDAVSKAIADSKALLAKGTKFTQSVEGNPTSRFAEKKPSMPSIPQAKAPSYSQARQQRKAPTTFEELDAKKAQNPQQQ